MGKLWFEFQRDFFLLKSRVSIGNNNDFQWKLMVFNGKNRDVQWETLDFQLEQWLSMEKNVD